LGGLTLLFLVSHAASTAQPPPSPPASKLSPQQVRQLLEKRGKVGFVPGEIIAKRKATIGPAEAAPLPPGITAEFEAREGRTSGGEVVFRLKTTIGASMTRARQSDRTKQAVAALRQSGEYEYVQPNYLLHIADTTPADTLYPRQWHYFVNGSASGQSPGGIGLPTTWDSNKGSAGIVVAVIDTGILPLHPDIAGSGNLVAGFDMISDTAVANDGDGRDADPADPGDATAPGECSPGDPARPSSWHGTHVAGTVGVGKTNNTDGVAGVNWTTKVQAVRVLGKCGGSIVDINDGIRWAAGLTVPGSPANPTPAKVINMSLGGALPCSESPSTQAAINDAVAAGTTVVVAAGNEASDASGFLPAGCNNVVAVAASDFRGRLVTRYSNFGAVVDILAPGGDVDRDDNGDGHPDGVLSMVQGGYDEYNGTSMASPHVAGVAALILAGNSALTPAQVESRLKASASPRTSTQCPRPCGAGLLMAPRGADTPPPIALSLSPAEVRLDPGGTATLTATVTRDGGPLSGETVTFTSASAAVASVNPATASTDASGRASTTVRGEARGDTNVRAQAQAASREAPVRVPALSLLGASVLAAILLVLIRRL
jgi:serine protease